ncbi:uncharacterized protein [Misgurnus anguillicaudatus]|uniref:uncharacterized protein n=1 Tax=Misgurnus anguillicaudatus TaxID=75329 RepID=UPI003CCF682C
MLSTGISCILLWIAISVVHGGFKVGCKGHSTTLSCLDEDNIKDKAGSNILWKKSSGEWVIWRQSGAKELGEDFKNRGIKINDDDLSLSIIECNPLDEGVYILCINGQPNCQVRLFVEDTQQCTQSKQNSSEKSTESPTFSAVPKQESTRTPKFSVVPEKGLTNEKIRNRFILIGCLLFCVVLLVVVIMVVVVKQKDTTENDKSESKLLHTVIHT